MTLHIENASFKNLNTIVTDFSLLSSQYEQQTLQASENFKIAFEAFMKDFFTLVPSVKTVQWNQYTPYFNDGDSCTFSVNDPIFLNFIADDNYDYDEDEEDEENEDYDDEEELKEGQWSIESWDLDSYAQYGLSEDNKDLMQFLSQIITDNEQFLELIFGDSKQITITAEGIVEEDYDHD